MGLTVIGGRKDGFQEADMVRETTETVQSTETIVWTSRDSAIVRNG
jgi:hypothetical protein